MARTHRGRPWTRCPSANCDYCVQGAARKTWHRASRRNKKVAVLRALRDPEHPAEPFDVLRPPNRR